MTAEPWTADPWPTGPAPAGLAELLGVPFADPQPEAFGLTLAVAAVHRGVLVADRYGPGTDATTALLSWSMAKSITHALIGILVRDGRLDIHAPAAVPEWQDPADPRHAITVDQLLRMSSGLAFTEDYVDAEISDTIEMLFGRGQADMASFAASFPLAHAPDTVWSYSSGTTNIICRLIGDIVGDIGSFMATELFGPLGMAGATPGFDGAGTFVGSSYVHAPAGDYLRFGQLYLADGVVGGRRLLPAGWVDYARTPTPAAPPDEQYGAHWWTRPDGFWADGYEGQYLMIVPERDLVLLRLGKTVSDLRPNVEAWLDQMITCFPVGAS